MVWLNRPGSTINGEPPYAISTPSRQDGGPTST